MLCLCVLCKYVNGNVYKHSVLHHKAYEFVSNIHGTHQLVLTYTRTPSRESARASHYVKRRSIRNIAKRKTEPESLK